MNETILVTGANRGIGLALCQQLHARGEQVIAVCRKSSAELSNLGVRVEAGIDVTNEASVSELGSRLNGVPIGVLINNAGLLRPDEFGSISFAEAREQFETNALGPLRVTQALSSNLGKGSKIVLITSRMGSIEDNTSGAMYGYRMSKAALNAAGASLARDLAPRGIAVLILHPGYVRTKMTGHHGSVDPAASAEQLIARIDELTLATTGRFLHANGQVLPW